MTLLELLVVLTVLALLTAALPALTGVTPRFEDSVRALVATLREARAEAVLRGAPTPVVFDLRQRRYGRPGEERAMPEGLTLELETVDAARLGRRLPSVVFFPDGGASGGVIRVSDGAQSAVVSVRWLTGAVRRGE